MEIRKGTRKDVEDLGMLYDTLNDHLASHINYPGWKKNIYPTKEDAIAGIEENALFVVLENDMIVGTMILRHKPEEAYKQADWHVNLDYNNIYVIYTFAVHPQYLHHGVGKYMMQFIIDHAKEQNMKAIRLDVYDKNMPAIKLYEKMGFEHIDTIDLGYSEYGLDQFCLYQMIL